MELFDKFKPELSTGSTHSYCPLGRENGYSVTYIPFEAVNRAAKLILVGITPGPKQLEVAYATARRLVTSGLPDEEVLRRTKQMAAFFGMRDKINEMLDHFEIAQCIGAVSASTLWSTDYGRFDATSIVPNAAFKGEAYFNGPFSAVLSNSLLRREFEKRFIPSLEMYVGKPMFVGMGPVVDEGLSWCAKQGVIGREQILGYLPHASGASGSQFDYFMRRKRLGDLKPRDPVRNRAAKLDAAYSRIKQNTGAWRLRGAVV